MLNFNRPAFGRLIAVFIIAASTLLVGCADRDEPLKPEEDADFQKASDALNRAHQAMQRSGVAINLADVGDFANLHAILPDPAALARLEDRDALQEISIKDLVKRC